MFDDLNAATAQTAAAAPPPLPPAAAVAAENRIIKSGNRIRRNKKKWAKIIRCLKLFGVEWEKKASKINHKIVAIFRSCCQQQ